MGLHFGDSDSAVGEGAEGRRDVSSCCGGRGIVFGGIGSGKSRSRLAMFARICARIVAWSMGSLLVVLLVQL